MDLIKKILIWDYFVFNIKFSGDFLFNSSLTVEVQRKRRRLEKEKMDLIVLYLGLYEI